MVLLGLRLWLASQISTSLDNTLISLNETLKTFIEEVWQLGSQFANIVILAILGLFYKPGYQHYWEQKNRIKTHPSSKPIIPSSPNSSSSSGGSSFNRTINKIYRSPKKPSSFASLLNDTSTYNLLDNSSSFIDNPTINFDEDDGFSFITLSTKNNNNNNNNNNPSSSNSNSSNSPNLSSISIPPSISSNTSPVILSRSNSNTNFLRKRKLSLPAIGSPRIMLGTSPKVPSTPSPKNFSRKNRNHHSKKDLVHFHEQITTGLFEDIRTNLLLFFDATFGWLRSMVTSVFLSLGDVRIDYLVIFFLTLPIYLPIYIIRLILWPFITIFRIFSFLKSIERIKSIPNKIISDRDLDSRTVREIIEQAGYPYESYQVTTEDGYILLLERIPNKKSQNVLYLQHGIFDNSFAWVATGPSQSIAFAAYDQGYDVFLTNLRGNGKRLHTNPKISSKDYWNFSMNEHAFKDTPAFIKQILLLKNDESLKSNNFNINDSSSSSSINNNNNNNNSDQINIVACAHSMGASILLMYIVKCGMMGIPHYLSKSILLSPAGYHKAAPKACDIFGPLLNIWLYLFPMYVFKFPSETLRVIIAKVYHDVMSNAPTKELLTYLVSRYLLGGDIVDHPLTKIHNLTYNTFNGTSVKLYKHFWQLRKSCKFQCFDYGSAKKNIEQYGTVEPTNIINNYNVIDIPIHFIMGLKDNLICPSNIIKHYNTLKKYHPDLAFLKASKNGHIEFTLGLDDQIRSYILNLLIPKKSNININNSIFTSPTNNSFLTTKTKTKLKTTTTTTTTTNSPILSLNGNDMNGKDLTNDSGTNINNIL